MKFSRKPSPTGISSEAKRKGKLYQLSIILAKFLIRKSSLYLSADLLPSSETQGQVVGQTVGLPHAPLSAPGSPKMIYRRRTRGKNRQKYESFGLHSALIIERGNESGAPNEKIFAKYLKYHFLLSQIVSEPFKRIFV